MKYHILSWILFLLTVGDTLFTRYVIVDLGAAEANPIIDYLMQIFGVDPALFIRSVFCASLIFLIPIPRRWLKVLIIFVTLVDVNHITGIFFGLSIL